MEPDENELPLELDKDSYLYAALDAIARDDLRIASIGLGVLFVILAIVYVLTLPSAAAPPMVALAICSGAAMFGLSIALGWWLVPVSWSQPIGVAAAGLVLLNGLLYLYITSEPRLTMILWLLIIGAGLFFLSAFWLGLTIVATLAGWGIIVWSSSPSPDWLYFGIALFLATVMAMIIHTVRLHTVLELVTLRLDEGAHRAELEDALTTTEEARRLAETMNDVGLALTSTLELPQVLDLVLDRLAQIVPYDRGSVMLLNGDEMEIAAARGFPEQGRLLQTRIPLGDDNDIFRQIYLTQRPISIPDVLQRPDFRYVEGQPPARSWLGVPLIHQNAAVGMLSLARENPLPYSDDETMLANAFAVQAAIGLQNARLYDDMKQAYDHTVLELKGALASTEEARRLAETMNDVGLALTGTLELSQVLDLVLDRLAQIVPYDRGSVMMLRGDEMEIVAARGFPEQSRPRQIRISLVGDDNDIFRQIYLTQRPLSIPDVSQRPDFQHVQGLPLARSWLGVPLIHKNSAIGMLSLARESPLPYRDDEIMLANAFAGQAAIGIRNARLYEDMKRAYAQLERMDRTKSDFIGVASHELRTPLTSLRGSSQILLNDPAIQENPLHQELISTIYSGAVRLHEIVDSMLDMIKIDSRALQLYPKPLSVSALIQTVCNGFARSVAARNLTLTVEDMQGLPEIEADLDALRKVFGHLVVNAIKYTPDSGTITISGRAVASGEKDLPEGIEVVVSDTGIGIAPESQELIFKKFYQTGELALHSTSKTQFKGGGPGLGLAIARGIVEAHSGKLWVASPGFDEETCPGSKFYVFLPLRQRRQVRPPLDPPER